MGKAGTKIMLLSSKILRCMKRRSLPTLLQEWTDSSLRASSPWRSTHVTHSHNLIPTKKVLPKKFPPTGYHLTVESLPCSHSRVHAARTGYRATRAQEPDSRFEGRIKPQIQILDAEWRPAFGRFLFFFLYTRKAFRPYAHTCENP